MPIRFRCAYCNQLMGIAHRKAGTVVSCPKCQGQVVVPHPVSQAQPAQVPAAGSGGNLFEQNDFPNLFNNPMPTAGPLTNAPAPAPPPAAATGYDAGAVIDQGVIVGTGVFLTSGKIALLAVGVTLLVGGAFFLGLLIGKS